MPKIKYYPVALRDRTVVKCCGADNVEEFFTSGTRLLKPCIELIGP